MHGEKIQPQPKPPPKPARRPPRPPRTASALPLLTRRQCAAFVYERAGGRCERCGRVVKREGWKGDPALAHVNERLPRSRGGNPRDTTNCELVCQGCHLGCGGHAPTVERQRRLLADTPWLG